MNKTSAKNATTNERTRNMVSGSCTESVVGFYSHKDSLDAFEQQERAEQSRQETRGPRCRGIHNENAALFILFDDIDEVICDCGLSSVEADDRRGRDETGA